MRRLAVACFHSCSLPALVTRSCPFPVGQQQWRHGRAGGQCVREAEP